MNTSMVTRAVKCQKISRLVVTFICYDNFCQRSHMARLALIHLSNAFCVKVSIKISSNKVISRVGRKE
uniref:Uncharacterized protein n=1 Tax=Glossina palpalis gambiensis TaxID=67801 RepID=A0A1B0B7B6_9MUSC